MKFILIQKRGALQFAIAVFLLAVSVLGVALTGAAQVYSGATSRKLPIHYVDTSDKVVALTFDACWGSEQTAAILKTLSLHDAKATYFVAGAWAEQHAEDLKALSESERIEIGSHSNTHQKMGSMAAKKIELEISASNTAIESVTGQKVQLFRAPFGDYSDRLISTAEKLGLTTVQWDVNSFDDNENVSSAQLTANVLAGVKNGSIILLHNDGDNTLAALPAIIEGLKNKGYSFKTVGELIYKENFTIDTTGKQIRR